MSVKISQHTQEIMQKIEQMTFEQALNELDAVVKKLESGKETLEHAISYYETGNALRQHCQNKLNEAKLRVDKIVHKAGAVVGTEDEITAAQ